MLVRLNGEAHRKIRFARARRAYAENHRLFADFVNVFALTDRFAFYRLPAGGYGDRAGGQLFDVACLTLFGKLYAVLRSALVYALSAFRQHQKIFYYGGGLHNLVLRTRNHYIKSVYADDYAELLHKHVDIFVKRAENAL